MEVNPLNACRETIHVRMYLARIYHVGDRRYPPTILRLGIQYVSECQCHKEQVIQRGHPREPERKRTREETLTSIRLLEARPSLPARHGDVSRRVCSPIRASHLCISRCPNSRLACRGETNRPPCCDVLWSPQRPSVPNEISFATGRPSCAAKILLGSATNMIISGIKREAPA